MFDKVFGFLSFICFLVFTISCVLLLKIPVIVSSSVMVTLNILTDVRDKRKVGVYNE